jgi:hypothetical protein
MLHVGAGDQGISEMTGSDAGLWSGQPVAPSRWLNRLRWTTFAIQLGVTILVLSLPGLDVPLHELLPLLIVATATNGAIATWQAAGRRLPRTAAGAALLLDVVLLTGLLEITGGPFNPFIVIYGVQVALAACTLGPAWAWAAGSAAVGGLAWLVFHHVVTSDVQSHHRLNDLPTHLFTIREGNDRRTDRAFERAVAGARRMGAHPACACRLRWQHLTCGPPAGHSPPLAPAEAREASVRTMTGWRRRPPGLRR